MTRKDYANIASVLRTGHERFSSRALNYVQDEMMALFQFTDPRFDAEGFVAACKPHVAVPTLSKHRKAAAA